MIIQTEENPVIITGSTVMFVCVVTGNPLPTIEWYFEGNPLTNSSRTFSEIIIETATSVLEICGLEVRDTGLYKCVGKNLVSSDSAAVNLTVAAPGKLIQETSFAHNMFHRNMVSLITFTHD